MIDKSKLTTISGTSKDSVFYVVGERDELRCGLRLFLDPDYTVMGVKPVTVLGFRLRITPNPGSQVECLDLKKYVATMFPSQKWSGFSQHHVSVSGVVKFECSYMEHEVLIQHIKSTRTLKELSENILHTFGWFNFNFTAEELENYMVEECRLALLAAQPPTPLYSGVSAVVVQLDEFKAKVASPQKHPNNASALDAIGLGGGADAGGDAEPYYGTPGNGVVSAGAIPGSKEKPKALKLKSSQKAAKGTKQGTDTPITPND